MKERLRNLIDDPRFQAYHERLGKPRTFSTFDVLRYSDYEIRHSNVLAWLLRPAETHGIGTQFLKRFLGHVNSELAEDDRLHLAEDGFEAENVDVWRERDHVDVMIRLQRDGEGEKQLIVVENKLEPGYSDHLEQVMGYSREQRDKHQDHTVTGVLLSTSPDGSVRIEDLERRVAKERRFRPVVHVGWDFVLQAVRSLLQDGAFPDHNVRAFIEQYVDLLDRRHRAASGSDFNALLDEHGSILKELRRVLEDEGDAGVVRRVPVDRTKHANALVRLVKETRHDPMTMRAAANRLLRSRGVEKPVSSNAPSRTLYWLTWTDPALADATERMGAPRGCVAWALDFSRRRVEIGFRLRFDDKSRLILARLERFMEKTPINRQKRDDHALEDVGYGWKKGYRTDLLSTDELLEMSPREAEAEVIRRLEDFMDSDDSEYRRIDDYFQCLAFATTPPTTA